VSRVRPVGPASQARVACLHDCAAPQAWATHPPPCFRAVGCRSRSNFDQSIRFGDKHQQCVDWERTRCGDRTCAHVNFRHVISHLIMFVTDFYGFFLVLDTQHVIKISENGLINFTNIDFEGQSPANFKSKELLIYYSVRPSRPMETRW
jgi:hypothetical protein